jgi:hypothetical protein
MLGDHLHGGLCRQGRRSLRCAVLHHSLFQCVIGGLSGDCRGERAKAEADHLLEGMMLAVQVVRRPLSPVLQRDKGEFRPPLVL